MKSTPWQALDRELGQSRVVTHLGHPDVHIHIVIARRWVMDLPTCWEAAVDEPVSGLTLFKDDFLHRRAAESWAWYRMCAMWTMVEEYRELIQRQARAHLASDGRDLDQRHVLLARIEKMAERDAERDQFSAEFWLPYEAEVDPDVDPDLRFVPAPSEAVAELEENPALLPDDGPAPA